MRTRGDGSVVAALLVWMTAGGEARAHPVPGDPDPGRHRYLLPGPLVSLVVPLRGERGPLTMDVGVELSLHRFVPTNRHIWSQWGYGAFAQAQLGGVLLQSGDTPAPSLHLRLAAGAQATFGPLGAQAGLVPGRCRPIRPGWSAPSSDSSSPSASRPGDSSSRCPSRTSAAARHLPSCSWAPSP
ncbi:MAG: hypothetical protein IPF99_35065 [Deltaproteobacteria bacterium]|nr:hypothetical protein [Deltaproteobacteria bacterium]